MIRDKRSQEGERARAKGAAMLAPLSLLAVAAVLIAAAPQAPPRLFCHPDVAADAGNPLGYRDRGDRCEGIYKAKVGSFGLALASLTGPLPGVDLRKISALRLAWASPGRREVRLEVASLRDDVHYRMDTVQDAGGSFSWPTGIPARYALGMRDLGMIATLSERTGPLRVHLPLRVEVPGAPGASLPYRVVVVPGKHCSEIYWSLHDGRTEVVTERKVDRGPYLPGVPVAFELSGVAGPGRYRLSLAARLREGGSEVLDVVFEHPR